MAKMVQVVVSVPSSLEARFTRFRQLDMKPVLPAIEAILKTGNREGILAGTDGYGMPMTPLAQSTLLRRHFTLSTTPLAPHGIGSRSIANFRTTSFQNSAGQWVVVGAWVNVLSKTGKPFLQFHFEGAGYLPVRDLAHVRPTDKAKIKTTLRNHILTQMRGGR